MIPGLDALARSLRKALGEQPERVSASGEAGYAITPSFEAFQWFRRASERAANYELVAARDAYGRALTIDPDFAQAWTGLTRTFFNLGYRDSAIWAIDQAVGHPERQTERGRLATLGLQAYLRGDLGASVEYSRRLVEEFGGDPNNLGNALAGLGRYAEAVVLMDEWDRLAPFGPSMTNNFVHAVWLAKVSRFDDAQSVAARLPEALALRTLTWVRSEAGDWVASESLATRGLALGTNNPGHRREFRTALAGAAAARGRIGVALSRLRENLAEYLPGASHNLLILALAVPARLAIDPQDGMALAADTTSGGMTVAAIWAAALGDTVDSKRLIAAVRARPPERRQGLDSALALAQEWVAASGGRWPEVRRRLGPLGAQGIFAGFPINPLVRWLVAQADERMGQLDSAVATYERIAAGWNCSESEVLSRGLTEPFAHQRLVVLYSQMGRLDDARRHWKIFSETFTQPDPEVVHLVDEARAALEAAERKG